MTWWIASVGILFTWNMLAHVAHLWQYAEDGIGHPFLKYMGRWMNVGFQAGFSVVLVAIAKGWNWSSDNLKALNPNPNPNPRLECELGQPEGRFSF